MDDDLDTLNIFDFEAKTKVKVPCRPVNPDAEPLPTIHSSLVRPTTLTEDVISKALKGRPSDTDTPTKPVEPKDSLILIDDKDSFHSEGDSKSYIRVLAASGITATQELFLRHYVNCGVVTTALKRSALPISVFRKWMKNEIFATAFRNANLIIGDLLESEGLRRAMRGSDKLLEKYLEAFRPEKFGKVATSILKGTEPDGSIGITVKNWAELVRKASGQQVIEGEVITDDEPEDDIKFLGDEEEVRKDG